MVMEKIIIQIIYFKNKENLKHSSTESIDTYIININLIKIYSSIFKMYTFT